jgi:hypothetical protein
VTYCTEFPLSSWNRGNHKKTQSGRWGYETGTTQIRSVIAASTCTVTFILTVWLVSAAFHIKTNIKNMSMLLERTVGTKRHSIAAGPGQGPHAKLLLGLFPRAARLAGYFGDTPGRAAGDKATIHSHLLSWVWCLWHIMSHAHWRFGQCGSVILLVNNVFEHNASSQNRKRSHSTLHTAGSTHFTSR